MERGEVWLVALPFSSGREQGGQRPAIVLQDAVYGQGSPLVLIVPVTSQPGALRFPGTFRVEPSAENDLSVASIALVFQTRAVDRSRFGRRLGTLSAEDLGSVLEELDSLTGR